ncbi:accessory gland protein Acp29AB-like [Drosophila biarmipes]|uniref:accessory gland protein Acp29AB-like n=1 Tax=Drosophila biarmipes TaxID=125945 RepID=UPI0007E6FA2B|nr:accessory gland protein Acp29AB-like [Drosophila biarmipes]
MLKFPTYFSLAIPILGLCGTVTRGQGAGRSVCLLHDPPNQCGKFCLEALKPMLDHIAIHQNEWSSCGAPNETQAKLVRIEDQQKALKDYLLKLKESLEKREASWKNVVPLDLKTKLDRIEKQLTDLLEAKSKAKVPGVSPLFQRIGERLIYVEKANRRNWNAAEESCRLMGGHLATIQNDSEFNAIVKKLEGSTSYWLGLTDVNTEGQFVSVASGKTAAFLKWKSGQPNNLHGRDHCVDIYNGNMYDSECGEEENYICEAVE